MITAEDVLKLRESIKERYLGELTKLHNSLRYEDNRVIITIVNLNRLKHGVFASSNSKLSVIRHTLYKRETQYYLDIYYDEYVEYTIIKKTVEAFEKGFNNVTADELEVLFL